MEAAVPLDAEKDGTRPESLVDGIDSPGQALRALTCGMVGKEGGHVGVLLLDAGENHAAFLVGIALAEERPGRIRSGHNDLHIVIGPFREDDIVSTAGLGKVLLEAVRDGKDNHLADKGMLGTELLDGLPREGGNLLRELLEGGHIMGKTAGNTDGLLRLDHILKLHAGDTPQFLPGPETREVEKGPDCSLGKLREVPGGDDAHLRELSHGAPADAPDILGRELPKDLLDVLRSVHVAPAP